MVSSLQLAAKAITLNEKDKSCLRIYQHYVIVYYQLFGCEFARAVVQVRTSLFPVL